MPELPEVETTLRGIATHVLNTPITRITIRNPRLRWPVPNELASRLIHQKITQITRRAKYLLLATKKGTLIIHLGMSGSLRIVTPDTPYDKHDHVEFCFANGNALRLKDPRRFGAVLWTSEPIDKHPLLDALGPEPLSDEFNSETLFRLSRNKTVAIKQFIMNSKVVVGIGNIYANEALFASGIHPGRAAGKISKKRYKRLCIECKRILEQAISQGGTTLKDFVGGTGKPGYFKQELLVYGRKGMPCGQCQKPLKEIRLGNRSTVYCTHCQK
ncbi:MAG: bifunctional DNA-formamidopyrimidine glycosylase/DNA-(apurinic or apyrimidinic site) lyase [gamma proteobacterium symbiont of Bathyaustriella thionipta]|nr:bifunctional DNA-formamidopyrimidine glycosylase/DNA-(apurinic or apyrimidinic site) lyase [gamma proteobacterium symbiont of Bathyaustriella thionipta]MCU7948937.1 bifunctional DNA-formamidopyrimidine glycosylase/DNA-(apurinic or apyrimidinic site) lyase [gamma proteobacterium symbiont of Bathyaustriella thionipta]MCU7953788.1 bifunctional DNA-formamidopyrimidine glycosylase/DNA-(apurinic or apyrimidinic site) lyase [gamma proteobacterium symbiont of Bathyaustriella thionipta]MCU7955462.1 bi